MSTLLDQLHTRLGHRYRVLRELAGGGVSRVFLAEDVRIVRPVVLKVIQPEYLNDSAGDRFQREVSIVAGLQHPNLVPLLEAGWGDGLVYFTQPYIEGESLRARLDRERELPLQETVRLLREVADALDCAHRRGVLLRDLSLDNILLSNGHAMVSGFGIAQAVNHPSAHLSDGDQADRRTDLYSLGVVGNEILISARLTHPPGFGAAQPAAEAALAAVIHRCLEHGFQNAAELAAALDALLLPDHPGPTPIPGSNGSSRQV